MKGEWDSVGAVAQRQPVAAFASSGSALAMLHAALDVEELWHAINKALRTVLTFHHSSMAFLPGENTPGVLRVSNPVADLRLYAAKIEAMAPVYAILTRNPNARLLRLSDEVDIESLNGTPFYKNFMEPEGWRYSASMIFREDGQMLGRLCLNRRTEQGDFTDDEMSLLSALYVHFNVAAKRVCRFEKERETDAFPAQDATVEPPTLLLDDRCAPVFQNRAAVRICALWSLGPELARVMKPEIRLPDEIRAACEDLRAEWQERRAKPNLRDSQAHRTVTHQSGLSAKVHVFDVGGTAPTSIRFLVHLSRNGLPEPDAAVLALLPRLTATELAVAKLVAWGLDNQKVAAELHISVNTVRAHLHKIFHKLELDSRTKLTVLLRLAVL